MALGASAGGLEALNEFFENVRADCGIAFVVITHRHAGHATLLPGLLARRTQMPVLEVSEPTAIVADHVYVLQPGLEPAIEAGVLRPCQPDAALPALPIDAFFRALAHGLGERAVAIVLSGMGSDGTLGIKEVKAKLGLTIAQRPDSAHYPAMPESALRTGMVDYVLTPSEMPAKLLGYLRSEQASENVHLEAQQRQLQSVLDVVARHTGHRFSGYKPSTMLRRVLRRVNVHRVAGLDAYRTHLEAHPEEARALFRELLIGVTSFFRDPEAWQALAGALQAHLRSLPDDHIVRVWVPGASTGEEAYTVAIVLRECMEREGRELPVQIFATDLDEAAVSVARAAAYPAGIAADVTPERLQRFFLREGDKYLVDKTIREMIVFALQNVISDPPFTKLDLLCCRNLLIYLETGVQRQLMPMFHYALRDEGLLLLGTSESLGGDAELFAPVDRKWKVFRRQGLAESSGPVARRPPLPGTAFQGGLRPDSRTEVVPSLDRVINQVLLRELVPPTVIVRGNGDLVHVHGRTGLFLEPAPGGQGRTNIFNMAREGLQLSLTAGLRQAAETDGTVVERCGCVQPNGGTIRLDLRIARLQRPEALCGLYRITFAEVVAPSEEASVGDGVDSAALAVLERELLHARENHETTTEELEATNEELKSANEELQSTNEELQSANEELETSKEELHSLNEELQLVNAELEDKVEELSRAGDDMKNLLDGTDIATIFLDDQLRIKRFTEQARKVIRLIPSDVGRPIADLVSTIQYETLVEDAQQVLETLHPREIEVVGEGGEVYLLRMLPYRTTENVIDGLVLTFVEVTKIKALQEAQRKLAGALQRSPVSVFEQDGELRFLWSCGRLFGGEPMELHGKTLEEVLPAGDAEMLREVAADVLDSGRGLQRRLSLSVDGRARPYALFAEPAQGAAGQAEGVSCIAIDLGSVVESGGKDV